MKKKIAILIIASIVALIALSAIQAYLISNTYELKKKAFIKETNSEVFDINDIEKLDSLSNDWSNDLKNHVSDYLNQRISKQEVLRRLKKKGDSLNPIYKNLFQQRIKPKGFRLRCGLQDKYREYRYFR